METIITVEPMADDWVVRQPSADVTETFSSGAKAEAAALRLASELAAPGRPSQVVVYLRGGAVGGRFICPANGPATVTR